MNLALAFLFFSPVLAQGTISDKLAEVVDAFTENTVTVKSMIVEGGNQDDFNVRELQTPHLKAQIALYSLLSRFMEIEGVDEHFQPLILQDVSDPAFPLGTECDFFLLRPGHKGLQGTKQAKAEAPADVAGGDGEPAPIANLGLTIKIEATRHVIWFGGDGGDGGSGTNRVAGDADFATVPAGGNGHRPSGVILELVVPRLSALVLQGSAGNGGNGGDSEAFDSQINSPVSAGPGGRAYGVNLDQPTGESQPYLSQFAFVGQSFHWLRMDGGRGGNGGSGGNAKAPGGPAGKGGNGGRGGDVIVKVNADDTNFGFLTAGPGGDGGSGGNKHLPAGTVQEANRGDGGGGGDVFASELARSSKFTFSPGAPGLRGSRGSNGADGISGKLFKATVTLVNVPGPHMVLGDIMEDP